jgi:hypothetical protein
MKKKFVEDPQIEPTPKAPKPSFQVSPKAINASNEPAPNGKVLSSFESSLEEFDQLYQDLAK